MHLLPPLLLETKGLADKAKCAILSCRPAYEYLLLSLLKTVGWYLVVP